MKFLKFALCIPTYKRTFLLHFLLKDISLHSKQPRALVIVDGDPVSGEVMKMLTGAALPATWRVIYVPSNHANLAYQRYLGWRVAKETDCDVLLYFDDDLRLPQPDIIERLIAPFALDKTVVGVTAPSDTGSLAKFEDTEALRDSKNLLLLFMARYFGSYRKTPPGGLTPVGHRRWPDQNNHKDYAPVQWLQGRVMAYRMNALDQTCFSEDLFAVYSARLGKGEDTFLSRQVGAKGTLLMAFNTRVEHPDADTPKAYPYRARKLAYATAYSRRFLNDHYRSPAPPTLSDRLALLKNYVGVTAFAWLRAITSFKMHRFAYALGYTQGAIRGLLQKPTAKNLTPHIDWWADAEEALARCQVLQTGHDNG